MTNTTTSILDVLFDGKPSSGGSIRHTTQHTELGVNTQSTAAEDVSNMNYSTHVFKVQTQTSVYAINKDTKEERRIFDMNGTTHLSGENFSEVLEACDGDMLSEDFIGILALSHFVKDISSIKNI